MSRSSTGQHRSQVRTLRAQFAQADGLPFADVLPPERLERALREEGARWREGVYTPVLTLWAFLTQVVSPDGSCRAAVARVLAWLVGPGPAPVLAQRPTRTARPATACPSPCCVRLARETGRDLHAPGAARAGCGRAGGSRWPTARRCPCPTPRPTRRPTRSTPPRPRGSASRSPGWWSSSAWPAGRPWTRPWAATRGKRTGEAALLRELDGALEPGDVLLADRYFGGWFDLALVAAARGRRGGAAAPVAGGRLPPRPAAGRRGTTSSPGPGRTAPDWLDEATYAALPDGAGRCARSGCGCRSRASAPGSWSW